MFILTFWGMLILSYTYRVLDFLSLYAPIDDYDSYDFNIFGDEFYY